MLTAQENQQRGRPVRSLVDMFRTRVWFHAVSIKTGLSAYGLEKLFHPEQVRYEDGKSVRPRRWDRYQKGAMIPKDKPENPVNLIDRVEACVPFSAGWFRHTLWRALQVKSLTQDTIDKLLFAFPDLYRHWLFEDLHAEFPRRKQFRQDTVEELAQFGDINTLAIAMLVLRESELIGSLELRDLALSLYTDIQPALMQIAELETCFPDLFSYIDSTYPSWIYPSPNQRMRVVIFSEKKFNYQQSYPTKKNGKTPSKKICL